MKELKINIPEGYCIDVENSTFECIKLKPIETYKDVCEKLFTHRVYYIDKFGTIESYSQKEYPNTPLTESNNALTSKQLEKLLAINKLMNVAECLNNGWKPNFGSEYNSYYYIYIQYNELKIGSRSTNSGNVFFKSPELANKAISILGEDIIKLAIN